MDYQEPPEFHAVIVSEYATVGPFGAHYELEFVNPDTGKSIYFNGIRDADTKHLMVQETEIPYTHRNGNRVLDSEVILFAPEESWQEFLEKARSVKDEVNDKDINYHLLGTNSNSAIFSLMRRIGLEASFPSIPNSPRLAVGRQIDLFGGDDLNHSEGHTLSDFSIQFEESKVGPAANKNKAETVELKEPATPSVRVFNISR